MQHLLLKIAEYKYIEWHHTCEHNDSVTDLFWALLVGVELLHAFPGITIMNYTYKTNPLLEIAGVTSTRCCLLLLSPSYKEKEANYAWAMDNLHQLFISIEPTIIVMNRELTLVNTAELVFPSSRHLLCKWHINKNVLANCR